jgi:hypothetical protein
MRPAANLVGDCIYSRRMLSGHNVKDSTPNEQRLADYLKLHYRTSYTNALLFDVRDTKEEKCGNSVRNEGNTDFIYHLQAGYRSLSIDNDIIAI